MSSPSLEARLAIAACALIVTACSSPGPELVPPPGALPIGNRQSALQPGGAGPETGERNPFEGDEKAIAEGKTLFSQFNCAGCHAAGGGAIGPALMDDQWTYGSSSSNIFWTIVEGRPQGMPAYGGRIPREHTWRLAAYVRSLSGLPAEVKAGGGEGHGEHQGEHHKGAP